MVAFSGNRKQWLCWGGIVAFPILGHSSGQGYKVHNDAIRPNIFILHSLLLETSQLSVTMNIFDSHSWLLLLFLLSLSPHTVLLGNKAWEWPLNRITPFFSILVHNRQISLVVAKMLGIDEIIILNVFKSIFWIFSLVSFVIIILNIYKCMWHKYTPITYWVGLMLLLCNDFFGLILENQQVASSCWRLSLPSSRLEVFV